MSKLDYCFEQYKSPNVHAIKKRNMRWHVRQHSTLIFFVFITYLLEDEQELSLGMLIRLCRIYNFWLFHANIIQLLHTFGKFLYDLFGLTYLSSAQCQFLFVGCFSYHRKSISNEVQTWWNGRRIFLEYLENMGRKIHARRCPREARGRGAPLTLVATQSGGWCPSFATRKLISG